MKTSEMERKDKKKIEVVDKGVDLNSGDKETICCPRVIAALKTK